MWGAVVHRSIALNAWAFLRPEPNGALQDGTLEQRQFVERALGTPDFALLEGPPGSGKTTAICDLIVQLAKMGKRVLLVASTHVAVDNVLERNSGPSSYGAGDRAWSGPRQVEFLAGTGLSAGPLEVVLGQAGGSTLIPRSAPLNTSRTLRASEPGVSGFSKYARPESSMPCWRIASPV
jgi:AAA domain